jgi:hypothetical protein
MSVVSEPAHSSLAQRIAKVRNCMLVEVSTGVPATDKDLFVSLCQTYEQNSIESSCTSSSLSQNALDQALSFSHLIPESILPHGLTAMSGGDISPRQHRVGFSIIKWPNVADGEGDTFDDWDKAR